MPDLPVTVYHNPACGTSRSVLAMLGEAGYQPQVVEYLKAGWSEAQLRDILKRSGASARDLLRTRGTRAEELGLTAEDVSEDAILAAMVEDPALVNRPIVATPHGAVLARPAERVFEVLEPA